MLQKAFGFLRKFWNGYRENFLIVEQRNGSYEVTLASRNKKKKEIEIRKRFSVKNLSDLRRPLGKPGRLVFSLNSQSATTAESVITLKRSRPENPVDEGELDQLIYQGFWDFLNHHRGPASKKMGTNAENLVLAYVQIREVYLGKQRIFNPVGFKGKELGLKIRGTFVSRELLPVLGLFKKWGEIFVFESGSIFASVLPEGNNLLAYVGGETVVAFGSSGGEQTFKASKNWGTDLFAKSVASGWDISESAARSITARYFEGKVSGHLGRYFESRFRKDFEELLDWLDSVKKKSGIDRPKLFYVFRYGPAVSSGYPRKLGGLPVRIDEELARREYSLKIDGGAGDFSPLSDQETLAFLTFEYFLPKFDFLNQLLKRRVRWLIPNF